MANKIIIPKAFSSKSSKEEYPFAELVIDKQSGLRVMEAICTALEDSFAEDEKRLGKTFRQRIQTNAEVRRRADICCKWFRILRAECRYSTSRAISQLSHALRTELDGGQYEPPKADGMYKA